MSNVTQQILTLLEDDAFPSMVILDGEWGAGKTYYINNRIKTSARKREKESFLFLFNRIIKHK